MEREGLLAAFDVVEKYAASGHAPRPMDLGNLVTAIVPSRSVADLKQPAVSLLPAAPAALPPRPPEPPYIHPELAEIGRYGATHVQYVRWALERMTDDFTVRDIAALLKREGHVMKTSEISVVLTRMKSRGAIKEITRSHGPKPALGRL
jgi:hypothetical protein